MFKKLKKTIGKNYVLSKLYHGRRLHSESRKSGEPIIVYQMGKVGSTSILNGLHKDLPECPVFHVHFLDEAELEGAKTRLKSLVHRFNANAWCLYESEFVQGYLGSYDRTRRIRVVTLVREVVSRNISSFFYNVDKYVSDFNGYHVGNPDHMEKLRQQYLDVFAEHYFPLEWFDKELASVFGVDVFEHEFDPDQGYSIIRQGKVDVLVLKLEKLRECAGIAFKEFLGINEFEINSLNTSDEQPYRDLYKWFLNGVQLPETYLNDMYQSKYMKKFYSDEEIAGYRKRWSRSV